MSRERREIDHGQSPSDGSLDRRRFVKAVGAAGAVGAVGSLGIAQPAPTLN